MTRLEDFLKLNKNRQIWTISNDQSVIASTYFNVRKEYRRNHYR